MFVLVELHETNKTKLSPVINKLNSNTYGEKSPQTF